VYIELLSSAIAFFPSSSSLPPPHLFIFHLQGDAPPSPPLPASLSHKNTISGHVNTSQPVPSLNISSASPTLIPTSPHSSHFAPPSCLRVLCRRFSNEYIFSFHLSFIQVLSQHRDHTQLLHLLSNSSYSHSRYVSGSFMFHHL